MNATTKSTSPSWRPNPLLLAATLLSGAIALLVAPSASAELAWGLAGLAATLLLAGVGELVERRFSGHTPRVGTRESRLLVAVGRPGARVAIIEYVGPKTRLTTRTRVLVSSGLVVDQLGFAGPRDPGLHVWEGTVDSCHGPLASELDELGWSGSWRRATPAEAERYAAGLPVWEQKAR